MHRSKVILAEAEMILGYGDELGFFKVKLLDRLVCLYHGFLRLLRVVSRRPASLTCITFGIMKTTTLGVAQ
jgi:hypothetical protein